MNTAFPTVEHEADLCVVGGGLAGLCAAVSAARHGARVLLMQDRPMLGGNASSEIRMWVCGAHGDNNRETGLLEEISMDNMARNPDKNYSIWDGILYEKARYQPGIELLLNCTCLDAEMAGSSIAAVTGWQMTTQTFHHVRARLFADCSGDSVLAPLTGAAFRVGREARDEFGEDIAPERADAKTMGMSVLIQARQEDHPSTFTPPAWAHRYSREDLLPYRLPNMEDETENFWYIELGGEGDAIRDAEAVRDELLRVAYGVWDYVKNAPENREKNANWRLDFLGILPGKRESRRYVGDHILTQNEVRAGGAFADIVAYGGWTMDDHDPAGFASKGAPNIFHPAPSPFGIPYRCLYSRNVGNLFFAGRNISVTHTAMSASRVMATCALLGQAVGTAAAVAIQRGTTPRGVYAEHIRLLQDLLQEDDCYLPGLPRRVSRLGSLAADWEVLRNGWDRPIGGADNGAHAALGQAVTFAFAGPTRVRELRAVFDSDLNRAAYPHELGRNMICNRRLGLPDAFVPPSMVRAFRVEDESGRVLLQEENNWQRLYRAELDAVVRELRFVPTATWGAPDAHLFALEVR